MTWEEMARRYEEKSKAVRTEKKRPKLRKDWDMLLKSTDKLVWLFSLSSSRQPVKR